MQAVGWSGALRAPDLALLILHGAVFVVECQGVKFAQTRTHTQTRTQTRTQTQTQIQNQFLELLDSFFEDLA